MTVLIIVFNLICWGAGILNCLVLLKVIKHRHVLTADQLTKWAKQEMQAFQEQVDRAVDSTEEERTEETRRENLLKGIRAAQSRG